MPITRLTYLFLKILMFISLGMYNLMYFLKVYFDLFQNLKVRSHGMPAFLPACLPTCLFTYLPIHPPTGT